MKRLLTQCCAEDLLFPSAGVTRVDPERMRCAAGNGNPGVPAEADDVAVGVDAGVLPQYVRARRVAGDTQRPRPGPTVPRARAREPGPLPAGIPTGVVEADPQPARRRIDG